jgi:hypothetical protein
MPKRTFDPSTDSDSDQEAIDAAQESDDDSEDGESVDNDNEDQPNAGKAKRARSTKNFSKVDNWNRNDMSDNDILAHIRKHLFDFNQDAGLLHVPGAHKDRNDKYGDWVVRRTWPTNKGLVENILLDCPLRKRCGCKAECKLMWLPTKTILFANNMHTVQDHLVEKDSAKYLKHKDKQFIRDAVRICPIMRWRWDRQAISRGHQVDGEKCNFLREK